MSVVTVGISVAVAAVTAAVVAFAVTGGTVIVVTVAVLAIPVAALSGASSERIVGRPSGGRNGRRRT